MIKTFIIVGMAVVGGVFTVFMLLGDFSLYGDDE